MQLFFKGSRDYCELFSRKACVFFLTFSIYGLRLIFVTLFLERILRATGGGARAGVRQGQRQLLGGDGLLCERLHLGKVEIMTMLTNFLSKSFKPFPSF